MATKKHKGHKRRQKTNTGSCIQTLLGLGFLLCPLCFFVANLSSVFVFPLHLETAMNLPRIQLVRQTAPQPAVADIAGEVRRQWLNSKTAKRIKPGMKIAVAVGSRGIANILTLAKA